MITSESVESIWDPKYLGNLKCNEISGASMEIQKYYSSRSWLLERGKTLQLAPELTQLRTERLPVSRLEPIRMKGPAGMIIVDISALQQGSCRLPGSIIISFSRNQEQGAFE